jgi:small subunit ribosomal protein S14
MAKKSMIAKDLQRREVVSRHATRRAELKEAARTAATPEDRAAAQTALQRLPRDSSPTRVRFREMAHAGELPGIRKSSW